MSVSVWFDYHNPHCDACGAMMAAEKTDEAAEAAMRAAGWVKADGKDLCRLCNWKRTHKPGDKYDFPDLPPLAGYGAEPEKKTIES